MRGIPHNLGEQIHGDIVPLVQSVCEMSSPRGHTWMAILSKTRSVTLRFVWQITTLITITESRGLNVAFTYFIFFSSLFWGFKYSSFLSNFCHLELCAFFSYQFVKEKMLGASSMVLIGKTTQELTCAADADLVIWHPWVKYTPVQPHWKWEASSLTACGMNQK